MLAAQYICASRLVNVMGAGVGYWDNMPFVKQLTTASASNLKMFVPNICASVSAYLVSLCMSCPHYFWSLIAYLMSKTLTLLCQQVISTLFKIEREAFAFSCEISRIVYSAAFIAAFPSLHRQTGVYFSTLTSKLCRLTSVLYFSIRFQWRHLLFLTAAKCSIVKRRRLSAAT